MVGLDGTGCIGSKETIQFDRQCETNLGPANINFWRSPKTFLPVTIQFRDVISERNGFVQSEKLIVPKGSLFFPVHVASFWH